MAFLGDFGKFFLGGASTGDVAQTTAMAFGADPITAAGIGKTAQGFSEGISSTGDRPDVATAPAAAGVDSRATTLNISQTGQLTPSGSRGTMASQNMGIGGLINPLLGVGSNIVRNLSRPGVGGAVTGFGGAVAADLIVDAFGNTKKLVITRRLQRDVKKAFTMTGGAVGFISANSMNLFGRSLSEDQIFMILFKTFKNQGPYVTRAAVRKTRSTIRKMEVLCDLKDRLTPARRAAPRRRMPAKSTTITNVR